MADDNDQPGGEGRQAAKLDPIAQALRATYNAENHDSLGQDLTGLMLELARVDDPVPATVPTLPTAPPSWRQRLFGRRR